MLHTHKKYWAARLGTAEILPMTRDEMDALGWDECDIIIVGGDAYIDHPSFSTGIVGRYLHGEGFRVGVVAQPQCDADYLAQRAFVRHESGFEAGAGRAVPCDGADESGAYAYGQDKREEYHDGYGDASVPCA